MCRKKNDCSKYEIRMILQAVLEFVKIRKGIWQFIKFCFVGLSNTLISYIINLLVLLCIESYNFRYDYFIANLVAFTLSVLWSFYWNNKYVFHDDENTSMQLWKRLIKTYIAYGFTGIIINNILSWIWIDILCVSKYIAPLINLLISVPLNFLINKLWAFKSA